INPEPDEPVFHAEWERRAFAIVVAMGAYGAWNIDMSRSARESMEPGLYLRTSYYEHWLHGLQTLLINKGFLTEQEIAARMAELAGGPT
ncbi:MAG: nitrile hydratase subunit beta, partial [Gammaproteobacteria bacterium]